MVLEIKTHIEVRGDDPLKAVVAGTNLKAYLVANLARLDGVDAAIEQYGLNRAEIYAALVFYYDHEAAIDSRVTEVEAKLRESGVDIHTKIDEMRNRLTEED